VSGRWLIALCLCVSGTSFATADPHQARSAAAQAGYESALSQFSSQRVPMEEVYTWSLRWYESERDAGRGPAAAAAHATRMDTLAVKVRDLVAKGMAPSLDKLTIDYVVAEAAVLKSK
jgi:hypothetical protein